MKHVRLALFIQVMFLFFNVAQGKDPNIQIEYRQEIKYGFTHNRLVEYFYFDSELDQKINYRIQSTLNYFYSADLSELAHEANKTYNHFNDYKQILEDYTFDYDTLQLLYNRFINQLSRHQVGDIIKSQAVTNTKQAIDKHTWYEVCLDSVCVFTMHLPQSIGCSYEIVEDSILIFNLWRWGINYHDTSKYNLIVNLNTGENISFYDLLKPGSIPKIKELMEYFPQKPWRSDELFSGGEFLANNAVGWFTHFALLPEGKGLVVYSQSPMGLYDFNIGTQSLAISFNFHHLPLMTYEEYLKPWVKRYLEGK